MKRTIIFIKAGALVLNLNGVSGLILSPAATEIDIEIVEKRFNTTLPIPYKELLRASNGLVTNEGIIIYGTDDILERNEAWETEEYAPGFISIGDDSGGRVFLLSLSDKEEILIVDSGDMIPDHAELISTNLNEWVNIGLRIDLKETSSNIDWSENCKIVVVNIQDGGLRDLIKIKAILGLNMSTSELLKMSKSLPFVLTQEIPYGKAKKLIEELGDFKLTLTFQLRI
ncbi:MULTISPECIES: SMI1/KNR4 family protein [unclassified Mesobacillus]|uniref:SMI1/KNR4 family protein n=1 Tax=unclassified Mesobacillus TaxID=2675270 RepID=UPI0020418262|nr:MULTISPECIES: SMI1/KNR4 family protein [unclassified Mesobacillus]MCM3123061.1 SMI1/KNR4 family protein [Mesobacillus sp. MER 33]MCM3233456.1 SMI1/KNR4 family protein [Mesobacillus sp. MER 48]